MAMLITSIEAVQKAASKAGWKLFCEDYKIDPVNPEYREEGVMIDGLDLLRYDMDEDYLALKSSVRAIIDPSP